MMCRLFISICLICALCGLAAAQRTNHKDPATGVHYAALENAATPQAAIALCLQHIQAQGGSECDASGIDSDYSISTNIFSGITVPVMFRGSSKAAVAVTIDLTVPANVTWRPNGIWSAAAAKTLTIRGGIDNPGNGQIFGGAGTVVISSSKISEVLPQWFGAVGDGIIDDSVALAAAISAAGLGTVRIPQGTYLFSSTISLPAKIHIIGAGFSESGIALTTLLKKSTLNAPGISITAPGTTIEYLLLDGQVGNGDNGINIYANRATLRNVSVFRQGNDGIRIGSDAGVNANLWMLDRVASKYNVHNGVVVADPADANGGTGILLDVQDNGDYGLLLGNGLGTGPIGNTFVGTVPQGNTAGGIRIVSPSSHNVFVGGDFDEANGPIMDLQIDAGAKHNVFLGSRVTTARTINNEPTTVLLTDSATGNGSLFTGIERLVMAGTSPYIQGKGGAAGTGGYISFTEEAGTTAGYGGWLTYNAYWDGSNWRQPRGDKESYLFTSNLHLGWSWRYAEAGGVDGGAITPIEVFHGDTNGWLHLTAANPILNLRGKSTSADGGIIQGTGEAGTTAGYSAWQLYNCYWDGATWRQPRGILDSYAFGVSNHLYFTWRYAVAGGVNNGPITLTEVGKLNSAGGLTVASLPTSFTLTTPTIASFVNAGHSHQNAAGGGMLDAAAIASGTVDAARLPSLRAGVLAAFCGGGFPGGSTVYMPGYGGASSVSYCTLTTETSGMPAPFAVTAKALYVKVGTAGCCAGSGIVRLRVNGANTALTCTVGTGTACSDVAHTVSITAGDIVTISVATGSPEVLADMNVTVGLWQ